jgi:hypothetical protein
MKVRLRVFMGTDAQPEDPEDNSRGIGWLWGLFDGHDRELVRSSRLFRTEGLARRNARAVLAAEVTT